ncbi:unnamed protein product [Protopolystoma xenopodis]|uniref:Uncharacterized protein n=1 Tax=Protopolystoma xenopodis TaxID=117903 RepID=A0A448WHR0_9PLAT|nr:unnamed protein product [Protopolystoma xenopodis]
MAVATAAAFCGPRKNVFRFTSLSPLTTYVRTRLCLFPCPLGCIFAHQLACRPFRHLGELCRLDAEWPQHME